MYVCIVLVEKGRREVKKGAWHIGSTVHNILNMRHKGLAEINTSSVCNNCCRKLRD